MGEQPIIYVWGSYEQASLFCDANVSNMQRVHVIHPARIHKILSADSPVVIILADLPERYRDILIARNAVMIYIPTGAGA